MFDHVHEVSKIAFDPIHSVLGNFRLVFASRAMKDLRKFWGVLLW